MQTKGVGTKRTSGARSCAYSVLHETQSKTNKGMNNRVLRNVTICTSGTYSTLFPHRMPTQSIYSKDRSCRSFMEFVCTTGALFHEKEQFCNMKEKPYTLTNLIYILKYAS